MLKNKSILSGWGRVLFIYLNVKSYIHLTYTTEIRKILVSSNAI